jgi:phosphoglucosamine mutase
MFGTSGVRGRVGEVVTAELALSLGRALATDGAGQVVVGRDARESGEFLAAAMTAGLRECGVDVIDVGLASTPTIARAVAHHDADAGVAITASHNPAEDNGIKLWSPSTQAFSPARQDRLTEVVESAEFDLAAWDDLGTVSTDERAAERHRETIVEGTPSLDGLDVVVDLGNGAGTVSVDSLIHLGADVTTLNATPDGRFPGRPSEPNAETTGDLQATVPAVGADLGIAHDGDADRMMAVDETGRFVSGDVLLALFARDAVETGQKVAVPVDTSLLVADVVEAAGGEVVYTPVGDVFVADRASEDDAAFGGEPSGAWIWPEKALCPDGPLAAATLAAVVADHGSLAELVDDVEGYPLRRANVEVAEKEAVMDRVEASLHEAYDDVDPIDGVRVETDEGWFLVRASGTQPLIRLTAEARNEAACEDLLSVARDHVDRAVSQTESA